MNTALFGLMPVFGMRSNDSDALVANVPLNGDPVPGVKQPFFRAEKRSPCAPSTARKQNKEKLYSYNYILDRIEQKFIILRQLISMSMKLLDPNEREKTFDEEY